MKTSAFPRRTFLQTIGAAVLTAPGASTHAETAAQVSDVSLEERTAISSLVEAFRKQWNVPGMSIAIARDGRMHYQEAFGTTDHESGEPLHTSHLFRIASISKPITSVAIFQLIEAGHLRLDDRIFGPGGLLGTKFGTRPYGDDIRQITLGHLLSHTSGWGFANGNMFSNAFMSQAELISWTLDNVPLEHPPGAAWGYSNFGYCLLGRVIERVAGQPYEQFVQTHVLKPAAIMDMHIAANTRTKRFPHEVIYYGQNGEDPYNLNVRRMDSHGGWIATPSDLVTFANGVTGVGARRALLKPDTVRLMTKPITASAGRAMGWNISGAGHWWHGGDLPGTCAGILVRLTSGLCWAALVNTRSDPDASVKLDNLIWTLVAEVKAWQFARG